MQEKGRFFILKLSMISKTEISPNPFEFARELTQKFDKQMAEQTC